MRLRTILLPIAWLVVAVLGLQSCTERPISARKRIGLVYIGPHELINQIVAGFRGGLEQELPSGSFEIVERHASGDKTQIGATINGALSNRLDVIATITTLVSQQTLKTAPRNLPIVFLGVTDPIGAGLAKSLDRPELTTGVSDVAPLAKMLAVIKEISPGVRKIGMPYSPEEQPAIYSRDVVKRLGPSMGFTIDARPVTSKDEFAALVRDLVRTNDAILVGADNGMFEAAPLIAKVANDARKPFFSADSSSVKAGAAAGVTIDYTKVGRAGAAIVAKVLSGARVGDVPVTVMTDGLLEVNKTTLQKLRLVLKEDVAKSVKATYK